MKKSLLVLGMVAVFAALIFGQRAWAAEPPPTTGTIVGPELWGVVVIDCGSLQAATLRVKRVTDCNVETQAISVDWTSCPASPDDPLNHRLTGMTLFDIDPSLVPIFTKVKNYKAEANGHVFSFDVQIKFWQP